VFLPSEPDLNWRRPEFHVAMMDVLRFWLERGADGFRIHVVWHTNAEGLPYNTVNSEWLVGSPDRGKVIQLYPTDQPEAHAIAVRKDGMAYFNAANVAPRVRREIATGKAIG
jgi:alpha-glucosidase